LYTQDEKNLIQKLRMNNTLEDELIRAKRDLIYTREQLEFSENENNLLNEKLLKLKEKYEELEANFKLQKKQQETVYKNRQALLNEITDMNKMRESLEGLLEKKQGIGGRG
jgi:hypothetical protein